MTDIRGHHILELFQVFDIYTVFFSGDAEQCFVLIFFSHKTYITHLEEIIKNERLVDVGTSINLLGVLDDVA